LGIDIETTAQPDEKVQAVPDADNIHKEAIESKKQVVAVGSTLALSKTGTPRRSFADKLAKIKEKQDNGIISPMLTAVKYGDQFTKKDGKKVLKPNITYTTPEGYIYKTDDLGRITSAEGTLQLIAGKRNAYAQKTVGRDDRLKDDDGGHLIATIFKGSGDFDNLVPMNGNLNKGEWKKLENDWAKALKAKPPKEVKVKIKPIYDGNSQRPVKFDVKYKIGNKWDTAILKNKPGGK
jgi:predicted ribonuclease toxin of YeeF-YezG toxin-antitoxin module